MDFCDVSREWEGRQACDVHTTHGSKCFPAWIFLHLNTISPGRRSCFTYLVKQRWKKRGSLFILYLLSSPFHSSALHGRPECMAKKSSALTLRLWLWIETCACPPPKGMWQPPWGVSLVLTDRVEKALKAVTLGWKTQLWVQPVAILQLLAELWSGYSHRRVHPLKSCLQQWRSLLWGKFEVYPENWIDHFFHSLQRHHWTLRLWWYSHAQVGLSLLVQDKICQIRQQTSCIMMTEVCFSIASFPPSFLSLQLAGNNQSCWQPFKNWRDQIYSNCLKNLMSLGTKSRGCDTAVELAVNWCESMLF